MYEINENFLKFPGGYLFTILGQRIKEYKKNNPDKRIISLGVGDVTLPLAPAIVSAMAKAVEEMGVSETFRGYIPSNSGYDFLKQDIIDGDFKPRGVDLSPEEVFISDGAKSDIGNLSEIFSSNNRVAICDPTYPAYADTAVIAGRAGTYLEKTGQWSNILYLPCTESNNFVPELPKEKADLIYLCFPNNPTGAMVGRKELQEWVDYALKANAVIIYDAAYEGYISDRDVPHTIYECDGAKACAIEVRSFSKSAGFTGTRLGYSIIPKNIKNAGVSLNDLWKRRQGTKYNGAPYIIQRGAQAIYTPEGRTQTGEQIAHYMKNAAYIRDSLADMGYRVSGGVDAPYIWMKTPKQMTSWSFFDLLLEEANVAGTPGSGFGPCGEGYFRLTGFGTYRDTVDAIERIRAL